MYENLNKPYQMKNTTINNRISMAPMGVGFIYKPTGEITAAGKDYFERRAKGGAGLIFLGAFGSDMWVDVDNPLAGNPLKDPDNFLISCKELSERVHKYGTKIIAQCTMGVGRNYPYFYAPSELPVHEMPDMIAKALTAEQIREKETYMIKVAKLFKEGGLDGFEIHALHWGYLLDEFATSYTNHRTDEYGGSLENRLRICKELIEGIKKECGEDFLVTVRLGLKSFAKSINKGSIDGKDEVGRTVEEAIECAKLLESWGLDGLSVDVGNYESFYYACPPMYIEQGFAIDMAAKVKAAVSIPVLLGGRSSDPALAEQAIADGKIDGIVVGRPMLADESYAEKILSGTPEKVRPCIACNQGCLYRLLEEGKTASCAVNPAVDLTNDALPKKAEKAKNILIVGGGLAGLEAARTTALRGHNVTIYEKTNKLGGNLLPAGNHYFKYDLHRLSDWYIRECTELNVKIHLEKEVTIDTIKELAPDAVILATGSSPILPKIEGIDKAIGCLEVLNEEKEIGQKVLVVGGGLVGCELALDLEKKGKDVTIVEALDDILKGNVPYPNKMYLKDSFELYGTRILTNSTLLKITDTNILISNNGIDEIIEADSVVISIGFKSNTSMLEAVKALGIEAYEVGDGASVGNVLTTVWSAFDIAKAI